MSSICSFDMDSAYKSFFRTKKGFPKFKSKHGSKQSFRYFSPKIDYKEFKIKIPKLGWVKFYKDKIVEGDFRFATISQSSTGRYYVSITYITPDRIRNSSGSIGIDLGIKRLCTLSNGEIFENQKYLIRSQQKLRVNQRKLARKFKKGSDTQSNNYYKQKLVVAKLHEKVKNQRLDYNHKVTTLLADRYHTICIEDLDIKGMLTDRKLAKYISDCSWGQFRYLLSYKTNDLRVIDRYTPSSKLCSNCGHKLSDLKLSTRSWTCLDCSTEHDRDINAAININRIGLGYRPLTLISSVEDIVKNHVEESV
jgi:transposase, IS605 OrfB family, central region